MITSDVDTIKKHSHILYVPQLRLKCAQGRDYIMTIYDI